MGNVSVDSDETCAGGVVVGDATISQDREIQPHGQWKLHPMLHANGATVVGPDAANGSQNGLMRASAKLKVCDQPKAVATAAVEGFEVRETLTTQWHDLSNAAHAHCEKSSLGQDGTDWSA